MTTTIPPARCARRTRTTDIGTARMRVYSARTASPYDPVAEAGSLRGLVEALEAAGRHEEARRVRQPVRRLLQPLVQAVTDALRRGDLADQALAGLAVGQALIAGGRSAQAAASIDCAERLIDRIAAMLAQREFTPGDLARRIVGPSTLRDLEAALRSVERDEAAGRLHAVAEQAGEAMTDAAVDTALRDAALARRSQDPVGEGRAMSILAGAFGELGRTSEADFCAAEAARLASRHAAH